ncbi:MAG: hypothetical protein IT462_17075 [Planctomycetes bacterium]|nr:hypothetical protein [Planctomycetota bacterium]
MSGPSRNFAVLFIALALSAGGLAAQLLPEIGEVEIQGANLTLLDARGEKRGTLKGKRASRTREGKVEITDAELKLNEGDSVLTLTFAKATYKPGSREIDLPSGLKGVLPDGGALEFAKGSMILDDERPMAIDAVTEGATKLRLGAEFDSDFETELQSAKVALAFDKSKRVERAAISGERGAKFNLRLSRVPDWVSGAGAPGRLAAECGGAMRFDYSQTDSKFELSLDRRCTVTLQARETGELTADSIHLGGAVVDKAATVTSMRATGNVEIAYPQLRATAAQADYAETPARMLKLSDDARVAITREGNAIECRAADWLQLQTVMTGDVATQAIELHGNARIQGMQIVGGLAREWVIEGRHCRIAGKTTGAQDFDFSGEGQNFAPLLTLSMPPRRVVLRGASATGSVEGGQLHADVMGPGITALCEGIPPLVPALRTSLALRDTATPATAAPVLLVLEARDKLAIDTALSGGENVRLDARGEVVIDQAPRDLNGRLSAAAEQCVLAVRAGVLDELTLTTQTGAMARLCIGSDLLQCAKVTLAAKGKDYAADMVGPGRLVFRDAASLRYVREALAELPASQSTLPPDAGWLNFSTEANLRTVVDERVVVARDAVLKLVHGGFVAPRTGLDAFKDLPELDAEDVQVIYEARGAAMYATILMRPHGHSGSTSVRLEGPAVVRSTVDGLFAGASDGISIQRVHREDRGSEPFEVLLTRDAVIELERAGRFLSGGGLFPFNGPWKTRAQKLIRLRFTPAPTSLDVVNAGIAAALKTTANEAALETDIAALRTDFSRALAAMTADQRNAFALLENSARNELANAAAYSRAASVLRKRKDDRGATQGRALALAALRAAQGSLGPQVDLEAEGNVVARFEQARKALAEAARKDITDLFRGENSAPAPRASPRSLDMRLERVEMSLDGVGNVKNLVATGPIVMSSTSYRLEGERFSRGVSGELVLHKATIILPPEAGIAIKGLQRLEIRPEAQPRMRAVGKKLKLEVTVGASDDAANGK